METQRRIEPLDIIIMRFLDRDIDGQKVVDVEEHAAGFSVDGHPLESPQPKPVIARLSDLLDAGLIESGDARNSYVTSERGRRLLAKWRDEPRSRREMTVKETPRQIAGLPQGEQDAAPSPTTAPESPQKPLRRAGR